MSGNGSPLDMLIWNHEPIGDDQAAIFRHDVESALQWAFDLGRQTVTLNAHFHTV